MRPIFRALQHIWRTANCRFHVVLGKDVEDILSHDGVTRTTSVRVERVYSFFSIVEAVTLLILTQGDVIQCSCVLKFFYNLTTFLQL